MMSKQSHFNFEGSYDPSVKISELLMLDLLDQQLSICNHPLNYEHQRLEFSGVNVVTAADQRR